MLVRWAGKVGFKKWVGGEVDAPLRTMVGLRGVLFIKVGILHFDTKLYKKANIKCFALF